jgi:hypothetical protein
MHQVVNILFSVLSAMLPLHEDPKAVIHGRKSRQRDRYDAALNNIKLRKAVKQGGRSSNGTRRSTKLVRRKGKRPCRQEGSPHVNDASPTCAGSRVASEVPGNKRKLSRTATFLAASVAAIMGTRA